MKLTKKLKIIVEDLKKYHPEKIVLFGSSASGTADQYSDIDIMMVKKTNRPFIKRLRDVALLCRLNEPIDILVYTPEEIKSMKKYNSFFMKNILAHGKVLYERQPS